MQFKWQRAGRQRSERTINIISYLKTQQNINYNRGGVARGGESEVDNRGRGAGGRGGAVAISK